MSPSLSDSLSALPDNVQHRLAGPAEATGLAGDQPVAFAGHVLRLGERGLLVVTDREVVFAAETGRVDRTPIDRLALALPRETLLTIAPGEGGRRQDEFRPLKPPTFAGVAWPSGLLAVQPGTGPRAAERRSGPLITVLVALAVIVVIVAAVLLAG